MTQNPISVTNVAVPKPPLKDKTLVRFQEWTLERIDAVAGKNRRAKFIRSAVEDALSNSAKRKPRKGPVESTE